MIQQVKEFIKSLNVESRLYQERVIAQTLTSYLEDGLSSILIESPTGSGKTIMALSIVSILQDLKGIKTGWISMRRNLLQQAQFENENRGFNADIKFLSMFEKNPPLDLDLLVIDEAQHDSTDSCSHLHNLIKPKYILGMTATPFRTDRVKLCFDKVIKDAGLRRLMEDGYLSKYKHWVIPEWSVGSVCNTYLQNREEWGKSIFFFHTLNACFEALAELKKHKIKVDVVTGTSNREDQIQAFMNGNLDCLINCMVLTEGFDCPELKTVFCRPSGKGVTIQMCGRAFRPFPGIKHKNIVQSKDTKWPFIKTATPVMQFIWKDEKWLGIEPKSEAIITANSNVLKSIAQIKVVLPKSLTEKKKKGRVSFRRGRSE